MLYTFPWLCRLVAHALVLWLVYTVLEVHSRAPNGCMMDPKCSLGEVVVLAHDTVNCTLQANFCFFMKLVKWQCVCKDATVFKTNSQRHNPEGQAHGEWQKCLVSSFFDCAKD